MITLATLKLIFAILMIVSQVGIFVVELLLLNYKTSIIALLLAIVNFIIFFIKG